MTRWMLLDEYTGDDEFVVGVCHEIEGLFADPEPVPPPETFTLLGCAPAGPLREAMDGIGTERAWLADIGLTPVHRGPRPAKCLFWDDDGCYCVEELVDVTVVGRRPSALQEGLVDLDLSGHVRLLPEHGLPEVKPDATRFRLDSFSNEWMGDCLDVAGVFRRRPAAPARPMTLIGFLPEASQGIVEGSKVTATILSIQRGLLPSGGTARQARRNDLSPRRPVHHRHRRLFLRTGRGGQRPRRLLRLGPRRPLLLPHGQVGRRQPVSPGLARLARSTPPSGRLRPPRAPVARLGAGRHCRRPPASLRRGRHHGHLPGRSTR